MNLFRPQIDFSKETIHKFSIHHIHAIKSFSRPQSGLPHSKHERKSQHPSEKRNKHHR